eukprot:g72645.t1
MHTFIGLDNKHPIEVRTAYYCTGGRLQLLHSTVSADEKIPEFLDSQQQQVAPEAKKVTQKSPKWHPSELSNRVPPTTRMTNEKSRDAHE